MASSVPSAKESLVLSMLAEGSTLYGLEMVSLSSGQLKRGTIYVTLSRMLDKGWVRAVEDRAPELHAGMPRPKYRITAAGQRALQVQRTLQGLLLPARRTT